MAQEKSKAVVSNEQIIKMLQNDDKTAVAVISSQIENCRTLDEIEQAIGQTSQLDRFAWIKISLLLAKIYETRTKKEASEANKRLQTELGYSKQQMSNFKKAGEKLLSGNYKTLKTGIVKFLNDEQENKTEKRPIAIEKPERRGSYKDSEGEEYLIFFSNVIYTDDEKKPRYYSVSVEQVEKTYDKLGDGDKFAVTFEEYSQNGKTERIPTFNFYKGNELEMIPLTSLKFVNL